MMDSCDNVYHIQPKRVKLAFDLKECAAHVSQDVHGELEAHSGEYKRHKRALEALEFPTDELTERQEHNANFFAQALEGLENTVCDGLWAASVSAAIQSTVSLEKDFLVYLDRYTHWLYEADEFVLAMSEVDHAYNWMKICMDIENHERLERYKQELFHGLRLVAIATIQHGYEFGRQIVELTNFQEL